MEPLLDPRSRRPCEHADGDHTSSSAERVAPNIMNQVWDECVKTEERERLEPSNGDDRR